ncbi:MAG: hypothetical protein KGI36_21840, partial [Burkholderiales bacterium]|nr:hypothetical protein [Burkholderiales bacterium]
LAQALADEPARRARLTARIDALRARIEALRPRLREAAAAQQQRLQEAVVAALRARQHRLVDYETQARLAIAQILDQRNFERPPVNGGVPR